MNFDLSVYFIADPSVCNNRSIADVVAAAVRGGATMIQLRNKQDSLDIIEQQAHEIISILKGTGVPLIINDHVTLAAKIGAGGVHIGQEDISPQDAREVIGPDKILGLTAYTREHYSAIDPQIVNYVGTGPVFPTKTKPNKSVLGLDGFAELIKHAPLPVVGIGGITPENTNQVIKAGANGVAMMRAISEADDVEVAAKQILTEIREATHRVVRKTNEVKK